MKASVIVLNWNGRAHLEICLPALAAQTFRDFEVIVVDNASSRDDSAGYVRSRHPEVRLVELTENRGFSGGNLAGVAAARGEFIVLLNNDTRPEPDWLERLVACAEENPGAGLVAAHLTDWEGRLTDSAGDGCYVTGLGFKRHTGRPVAEAPASGPCFGACAGAALYRREMIEDIGFLDADFFLNHEDTDLSLRAQMRGWTGWFCREAVVRHRVSASQQPSSVWNVYYGTRNYLWVCAKNLPLPLLLKYSPVTAAALAYMGGHALFKMRFGSFARGFWAGLAGGRRQLRKRRALKPKWRRSSRELDGLLTFPRLPRSLRGLWAKEGTS